MKNVDKQEINKFSDIADEWWNKDGDFKPLHVINPLRAKYIKDKTDLKDKNVSDEDIRKKMDELNEKAKSEFI